MGSIMKYILTFLCVLIFMSCQAAEDKHAASSVTDEQNQTTAISVKPSTSPHNGTYIFDALRYKTEQLKYTDSLFKDMKPEDIDKMMHIFKPFTIEVEGDRAVASFSSEIIKGKLTKLSSTATETRLHMTPVDAAKKDQTVTLIIQGKDLILDPGKAETDKMYFTKVE